jgi:hypothetical protein
MNTNRRLKRSKLGWLTPAHNFYATASQTRAEGDEGYEREERGENVNVNDPLASVCTPAHKRLGIFPPASNARLSRRWSRPNWKQGESDEENRQSQDNARRQA